MKWMIGASALLLPSLAYAGEGGGVDNLLPAGLKLLGALVLVLGLILLFYALSRKGFGFLPSGKSGIIKMKEMRYLMPKKALCLVEVRGEELLLSIAPERIELITRFDRRHVGTFEENLRLSGEATQ